MLKFIRPLLGVALIGLWLAPAVAVANASEAKLAVSATVMKHASLKVLAQPASVMVTAADIARGYVDVSSPSQVAIQSNSLSGYMLMFATEGEFMRQTLVGGLGNDVLASIQRLDIGLGFESGLAVVLLAIMLDRITETFGAQNKPSGFWDKIKALKKQDSESPKS